LTQVTQAPLVSGVAPQKAPVAVSSRLDDPRLAGFIALVAATAVAVGRYFTFAHRQLSAFMLLGQHWITDPSALPPGLVSQPGSGYDGQFFYRLALNPADLATTAYGISVDTPYRFIRDGYPFLAWLLSFGQQELVPLSLVVVNVLAIAAMGLTGGMLARDSGRHALWGLLLAGYFGLVTTLTRDTAEAVGAAFLLAGLVALRSRPRRPVLGGLLLGYGSLSRETAIIVPVAFLVVRLAGLPRRRRLNRDDLGWAIPIVMFTAWQVIVYAATGSVALLADKAANAGAPLAAPASAISWNFGHLGFHSISYTDEWALEFILVALVVVCALAALGSTSAPVYERLAFVIYIVEICVITPSTWSSLTADMRSFIEVWLMGLLVLFGTKNRPRIRLLAYRLPVIAIMLVPILADVIFRRMTGT
jgi:hypothetical protein